MNKPLHGMIGTAQLPLWKRDWLQVEIASAHLTAPPGAVQLVHAPTGYVIAFFRGQTAAELVGEKIFKARPDLKDATMEEIRIFGAALRKRLAMES